MAALNHYHAEARHLVNLGGPGVVLQLVVQDLGVPEVDDVGLLAVRIVFEELVVVLGGRAVELVLLCRVAILNPSVCTSSTIVKPESRSSTTSVPSSNKAQGSSLSPWIPSTFSILL